ncbi:MAG TPA: delta-60 repeat domain-containing protein, partial [Candidatus Manganitrophaceae bacterium]|nr:delta-60 repeat domain-containing protein [Candidatus Manganitrophaceae bacterium]
TVTTHFGDSDSATHTLLIQANGQILVSGYTQVGSLFVPVLARYDSNGSLDAAFGTGGKVIGSPEMSGFFMTAALQADGRILMAGNSIDNSPGFLLTRFNGDGSIDTTFGVHGQVVTHLGFDRNSVAAIGLYSDGKILAAGSGAWIGGDFNLALARYWP